MVVFVWIWLVIRLRWLFFRRGNVIGIAVFYEITVRTIRFRMQNLLNSPVLYQWIAVTNENFICQSVWIHFNKWFHRSVYQKKIVSSGIICRWSELIKANHISIVYNNNDDISHIQSYASGKLIFHPTINIISFSVFFSFISMVLIVIDFLFRSFPLKIIEI